MRILGILFVLLAVEIGHARGVQFTFDQDPTSCAPIDHWDIYKASITTAVPNPTFPGGPSVGTITNVAPLVCGLGAKSTLTIGCSGNTRWWLKAVSTSSSTTSVESNPVDVLCPLVPPVLRSVLP